MRAFVIRPFGTRKGIDFNNVEGSLIRPALQHFHVEGGTTGEIMEAGNIRIDMFRELLTADLVIADISTNNPNAFYELGIRHALQEKRTFLIRAKTLSPATLTEQEKKDGEVPFDLKTERYLEYDPAAPQDSLEKLKQGLGDTIAGERQDSPVFLLLPGLQPQKRESFTPVPLGFNEEVQKAEKAKNCAKLTLLGLEAQGFPWEATGQRTVGRSLFSIKELAASKTAWESLLKLEDLDYEANQHLGNIYQRQGDLTASDLALERALRSARLPDERAEIHGQMGRNKKELWKKAWAQAKLEDKPRAALDSLLLVEAYKQYLLAYRQDLDSYYPGINALGLAIVIVELAEKYPETWSVPFNDEAEAQLKLTQIKRERDQIGGALHLRFDGTEASKDPWFISTTGDLHFLTQTNAKRAAAFYRRAADADPFVVDSVRRQLTLYEDLGVMAEKVKDALAALPARSIAAPAKQQLNRVILFTGHRIDLPGRKVPRFPADKESVAREAIRKAVQQERESTPGPMLGIAGGANGGDILFLEVCDDLSIPTELLLALPEDKFVTASVQSEDPSWERRFSMQMRKHQSIPILAEAEELPKWLEFKKGYDIWQRNNLWLLSEALSRAAAHITLIALWDGEQGDGPGGTEHMVKLAKERGAKPLVLNTKALFGL